VADLTKIKSLFNSDSGASLSNEYEVTFSFTDSETKNAKLLFYLKRAGFSSFSDGSAFSNMMLLCDEASLPGTFAATNEIDGIYAGRMIQYPHGRIYNDFRLSFIMTNECNPNKFFDVWMNVMFPERDIVNLVPRTNELRKNRQNITTISYYDTIVCPQMTVVKTFKTKDGNNKGKSLQYDMINAYPYSIESVPLGYGASTLNKLRVSFRYEKHYFQSF
jgi:hypothetical protein